MKMNLEIPEFADWKEEAEFWDHTDTAPLMEEEGEWVGPGRVKSAPGLCRRCGAQMQRQRQDVIIAHGRLVLHEADLYICPRCGAYALPSDRQEFVVWSARAFAPEGVVGKEAHALAGASQ
jgi:ribosomal protein L40E